MSRTTTRGHQSRLRREKDILERIDNVKRLIEMETTLTTGISTRQWIGYKAVDSKGQSYTHTNLLDDVREEIRLQLLSIAALCYGDNPDIGEPYPMLEWASSVEGSSDHPSDILWEVWQNCLRWNA